jgi:hypothetical protein
MPSHQGEERSCDDLRFGQLRSGWGNPCIGAVFGLVVELTLMVATWADQKGHAQAGLGNCPEIVQEILRVAIGRWKTELTAVQGERERHLEA